MSSSESPAPSRTPKRILVVDDDASVRASLAAVLESEHYEVLTAADGRNAIKMAVDDPPDLVLLDLNMPNMDGWTAFSQLEAILPLTPVVVITARSNQYAHAVELGVDAYMEKPLNIPLLLEAVCKLSQEPREHHIQRITNPRFVTACLGAGQAERQKRESSDAFNLNEKATL